MNIKSLTIPYRKYNEDGLIITDNLYVVLDGATTLYETQSTNDYSIASKLVDYMIDELPAIFASSNNDFEKAIHILSEKSYDYFGFTETEPAKLPSVSLAAVVVSNKHFKLYLLGDVSISYKNINNNYYRFTDTSLDKLDSEVIELFKKYKSREKVLPYLIRNRNFLGNKYQAFIPSKEPEFNFKKKQILKSSINRLSIYSDGYYSIRDTFKIVKNHKEFLDTDIKKAADLIQSAANNDKEIIKYPRLKHIDDISVIELTK